MRQFPGKRFTPRTPSTQPPARQSTRAENNCGKSSSGEANAVGGSDEFFVIEADEYDGAFLGLNPALAIVTNIDYEHPDMFESIQDVQSSFTRFMRRVHTG